MPSRIFFVGLALALCVCVGCDKSGETKPSPSTPSTSPASNPPAPQSTGVDLLIRPVFKPGLTLYVEFSQDVSSVISEAGAPDVPTGLLRLYGMLMKVESASDAGTVLTYKLDRAAHTKRSMHLQKPFDSDNPVVVDDIGMTDTYMPLLGGELKFMLDNKFRITELKNADIFEAKIKDSKFGPIAADAARDFAAERLRKVWVEYPLALYPDHPVKVADTWTNTITEVFPIGKVELPHECKLERVSTENGRKTAVVSFRGTMKRLEKEFPVINGVKITSYQFTFDGQAVYDFELGQFVNRTQVNRTIYKYPGKPSAPNQAPPEQTISVTAQQNYRILGESQRKEEKARHLQQSAASSQSESAPPKTP
jgi:hypothetical protein